ncbi:uncharacterized protein BO80DRAFT_428764 [Aspergillus ibericus CBS 121593]|uniref:Oxidase ustYa n=1 Tax=Aspergillus ibericus CBS 121593 TaxID=1448316 RepID=A0A395GMM2_9EURO|nr:hypothetical protein BO80DRAFT_428764 [Aspergillus ibericus CBS 121593]RAK96760.1 hypothetical protein BO80DRAFT_428764 [Aspergillus ibericus CBS 121593]
MHTKPTPKYPKATGLAILISTLLAILYLLILRNITFPRTAPTPCICPSTPTSPPYTLQTFFPPHTQTHPQNQGIESLLSQSKTIPNNGFITITEQSSDNPQPQYFGISMFHQLHCLDMIRDSITTSTNNNTTPAESNEHHHTHHTRSYEGMHIGHCLDYLAQVRLLFAQRMIRSSEGRKR